MSEENIIPLKSKPLSSRFVEHFDFIPPPELLDIIQENSGISSSSSDNENNKKPRRLIITDPFFFKFNKSGISPIIPSSSSSIEYNLNNSSRQHTDLGMNRSYSNPTIHFNSPLDDNKSAIDQSTHNKHEIKNQIQSTNDNNNRGTQNSKVMVDKKRLTLNNNHSEPVDIHVVKKNQVAPQEQLVKPKEKTSRKQLNRAEVIIQRYGSWNQFLTLVITWLNEIMRALSQTERSLGSIFSKNSMFKNTTTINDIYTIIHGFTTDLVTQEQEFVQKLKAHLLALEKIKKDCSSRIKNIKSRADLGQEEFLRRAEITIQLMTQLSKACKQARNTIEKGSQLTNDPWLANLHVLRQLKREVDEDNRLRKLLVPIQQEMREFETNLLKSVESALKDCFELPTLTEEKIEQLQFSLNQAITNNWESFIKNNKKMIVVNENHPEKNYLKINYPYKNDPLVMTLFKGQLERKVGVLNKFTPKFFVLTESGFLHQFKLNDNILPETTIYIPKANIIPSIDINQHNEGDVEKKNYYTFEIHRSGSLFQRDKTYVFRTTSLEEMITWCKTLETVSNRRLNVLIHDHSTNAMNQSYDDVTTKFNPNDIGLQYSNSQNRQESTPPPSPPSVQQIKNDIVSSIDITQYSIKRESSIISDNEIYDSNALFTSNNENIEEQPMNQKHGFYSTQLNIEI